MNISPRHQRATAAWVLVGCTVSAVAPSCSSQEDVSLQGPVSAIPAAPGDSGANMQTVDGTLLDQPLCIGTECPGTLVTCPGTDLCAVDTATDPNHCGGCGIVCPNRSLAFLQQQTACIDGVCQAACFPSYGDCDARKENGCETSLRRLDRKLDPISKNCGTCGFDCIGEPCIGGRCGCPPAFPDFCPGESGQACVDLNTDVANCGVCRQICAQCGSPTVRVAADCQNRNCGLKCQADSLDCDKDLSAGCGVSNGCETLQGPDNCGACGLKCTLPEVCTPQPGGAWACQLGSGSPAKCPEGTENCAVFGLNCVNLEIDSSNCGDCGVQCVDPGVCRGGVCVGKCGAGLADCDGNSVCETNILTDSANCGACGVQCESGLGQPCVGGKCLMVPCPPDPGGIF